MIPVRDLRTQLQPIRALRLASHTVDATTIHPMKRVQPINAFHERRSSMAKTNQSEALASYKADAMMRTRFISVYFFLISTGERASQRNPTSFDIGSPESIKKKMNPNLGASRCTSLLFLETRTGRCRTFIIYLFFWFSSIDSPRAPSGIHPHLK